MITKTQIEDFYRQGPVAIVGVSRNKKKFGRTVYAELKKKGIAVLPVNPNTDTIDGDKCYKDVASLPEDVKAMVVITPKNKTEEIVKQAGNKGIKHLWIQQMSDTPEALEIARQQGMNLIHGRCIMMFSEPVAGMHKFHRGIMKFFGRLPK